MSKDKLQKEGASDKVHTPPATFRSNLPRWQQRLGHVLSALVWAMVFLMFFNVIARYALNRVWIPLQELVVYFHATIFMAGAVLAWRLDRHVRVDVFQQRLTDSGKARIDVFGRWFLLLPFVLFMLVMSFDYVRQSWLRMEGSAETGGLPGVFLLKSLLLIVPAAFLLLLVSDSWHVLRLRFRASRR